MDSRNWTLFTVISSESGVVDKHVRKRQADLKTVCKQSDHMWITLRIMIWPLIPPQAARSGRPIRPPVENALLFLLCSKGKSGQAGD